MVDFLL
jgi:hypothetical protein